MPPRKKQAAKPLEVSVKQVGYSAGLALPSYESAGAAGMDVMAAIPSHILIPAGGRALVPTGLAVELPEGYEIQVRPRSGLALKEGITVLNAPGTIDSDYRGEIGVILSNTSDVEFTVRRGARIAQIVFAPVTRATLKVGELGESERGDGGFGSTGED